MKEIKAWKDNQGRLHDTKFKAAQSDLKDSFRSVAIDFEGKSMLACGHQPTAFGIVMIFAECLSSDPLARKTITEAIEQFEENRA